MHEKSGWAHGSSRWLARAAERLRDHHTPPHAVWSRSSARCASGPDPDRPDPPWIAPRLWRRFVKSRDVMSCDRVLPSFLWVGVGPLYTFPAGGVFAVLVHPVGISHKSSRLLGPWCPRHHTQGTHTVRGATAAPGCPTNAFQLSASCTRVVRVCRHQAHKRAGETEEFTSHRAHYPQSTRSPPHQKRPRGGSTAPALPPRAP